MDNKNQFNYEEEAKKCRTIEDVMGPNGLMKKMLKGLIENMLQAELEAHLGYAKNAKKILGEENSRNGYSEKIVRSSAGNLELEIPRDRSGSFEPLVVKKHQKDVSNFDDKIISMYAKGMTTRDIQEHVKEVYGAEISPAMVSMITDKIEGLVTEWQNRVLATVYAVVYFDAIHYKVRENGKIACKAAYTCLGIDTNGRKDILGLWIGESEGARFWASVFSELRSRGVVDILIACVDGLKGLPDALRSIFPGTEVQLCIVHMIRNSLRFVGSKNQKEFLKDLKEVYQAASSEAATSALDGLVAKWRKLYPLAVNPWVNHWENVSNYFKYSPELRRMIYTTNAVEALHRQFRKVTKNRSVMPNDNALLKLLYLAARDIQKKWTMVPQNWSLVASQLHIHFGERFMTQ
jgi:transposase-like protein